MPTGRVQLLMRADSDSENLQQEQFSFTENGALPTGSRRRSQVSGVSYRNPALTREAPCTQVARQASSSHLLLPVALT